MEVMRLLGTVSLFCLLTHVGRRVTFFQKFQTTPYKLVPDRNVLVQLNNLKFIDDDEMLYQLS